MQQWFGFKLLAHCPDNCTNFFDNCVFYMLQLFEPSSLLSSSTGGRLSLDSYW